MELNFRERERLAEIWLTRAEADNAGVRDGLRPLYPVLKAAGYLPVVYMSGAEDLAELTGALIRLHRQRSAERAVRAAKAGGM